MGSVSARGCATASALRVYRERMAGLLIGFIWLVIVVGGGLALAALIAMVKSPYRNR